MTSAYTSAWVGTPVTLTTTTATTSSFTTNGKYNWVLVDPASITYNTTGLPTLAPRVTDNKLHINVKNHKLIINFDL